MLRIAHSRALSVVFALAVGVMLAGCSAATAYPIFDKPQTASDSLPSDFDSFDDGQLNEFDLRSVRFAAAYDGTDLFLLKTKEGGTCLAVADGTNSVIACGGRGQLGMSAPSGSYEVAPAPIAEKPGWTVLSENIRVEDGS